MKEAIAFFAGLITMMVVWFYTDYFAHDSAYRRGYRQALKDAQNENQCEQCIYYYRENNTCQLKKCSTLGGEGYVTSLDRKFCEFCKKDEG